MVHFCNKQQLPGARRGQGLPCARHSQLHNWRTTGHSWSHQPSWWHPKENIAKEGQKTIDRGNKKSVRNNSVSTEVREEGKGRGAPGAGTKLPPSLWKDHAGTDIHTAACGRLHAKVKDISWRNSGLWKVHGGTGLFWRTVAQGRAHAGAGKKCYEDEAAAQRSCYGWSCTTESHVLWWMNELQTGWEEQLTGL